MKRLPIALCLAAVFGGSAVARQTHTAHWVASWATSPVGMKLAQSAAKTTFRNTIHVSLGGDAIRITLTNEFGSSPLLVKTASVYTGAGSPGTGSSSHMLTFGGDSQVLIPAGGTAVSDSVTMKVPALSEVTVSIFLPDQTIEIPTCHEAAIATNLILSGDQMLGPTSGDSKPYNSWCFLKDLQVQADEKAATIVAFGDSITDGAHATVGANHRWPDYLAARLQADPKTSHLSVVNEGIGGNRILFNGHGPSAAARFDRDVLAQPGVKYVILLEGINDIDQTINPDSAEAQLTVQQLISAATQMVERAHAHGIMVYGATLTPNGNRSGVTPHVNELRSAYNQWLRTAGVVDAVIDFDKAVRDIQQPGNLAPANDSGDHLHPSDAGYKAMADAIDLALFQR